MNGVAWVVVGGLSGWGAGQGGRTSPAHSASLWAPSRRPFGGLQPTLRQCASAGDVAVTVNQTPTADALVRVQVTLGVSVLMQGANRLHAQRTLQPALTLARRALQRRGAGNKQRRQGHTQGRPDGRGTHRRRTDRPNDQRNLNRRNNNISGNGGSGHGGPPRWNGPPPCRETHTNSR